MRYLHSFLYFLGVGALCSGVIDCVAIALGGTPLDLFLAIGFVLFSLGCGLRYNGAGHPPARASFLLLGLAATLPQIAWMAPLSAIFALLLFLPLRALGANLGGAIARHPANTTALLLASILGANLVPAIASGLPGFITVWAFVGALQYFYLKDSPATKQQPLSPEIKNYLLPFFAGSAIAANIILLIPYATVFDYATAFDNTLRVNTIFFIFTFFWFTVAAGLADSMRKASVVIASGFLVASAILMPSFIGEISTPDLFSAIMQNPKLISISNSTAPFLAESNFLFIPLMTAICFALPILVISTLLRSLFINRTSIAAVVNGFAITFALFGLAPLSASLNFRPSVAIALAATTLLLSLRPNNPKPITAFVALTVSMIGAILLPQINSEPTIHFAAKDNFIWTAAPGSSKAQLTHVNRKLTTNDSDYDFDGLSPLTPLPNDERSHFACSEFISSLATTDSSRLRASNARQVINSDGGHLLIELNAKSQYKTRRSLLRHELFRQAAMRLAPGGIVALRIASDDLSPTVAPQIAQSFRDIFDHTRFFIFSDSLATPFIVFVGGNDEIKIGPSASVNEFKLTPNTTTENWMLHAPWRPVNYILAATTKPSLNPESSRFHRAADVIKELATLQPGDSKSLLNFYAQQMRAQEYSVH
ncbi:MAG: hypothetical protein QGF46_06465, partial [Planctomycetota bacterium]|nr:hypothetical protein [Planctomycetota bacterium]